MKRVLLSVSLACVCALASAYAQGAPRVRTGFTLTQIASVPGARELTVAPNGDLLVGTTGAEIFIIPHADATPGAPGVFARIDDAPVAGVTMANGMLYAGGQFSVWRIPYHTGDRTARTTPEKIASVRTSGEPGAHVTTSVAFANGKLYASVGSSCNNCDPELDATRATIQEMDASGAHRHARAIHIRNAIALAVNPATQTLWAGVAGQDELAQGHPFEIFDPVTRHAGVADYGWPYCYENHRSTRAGRDCAHAIAARVVFPAYDTPIGAVFYPAHPKGAHVFPSAFWGGAFVTLHGSWHQPPVPPRVAFVPMHGDDPLRGVDWQNPAAQWSEFIGGFQTERGARIARPTGIAVGPQGDVFVADDQGGAIYRIRPASSRF